MTGQTGRVTGRKTGRIVATSTSATISIIDDGWDGNGAGAWGGCRRRGDRRDDRAVIGSTYYACHRAAATSSTDGAVRLLPVRIAWYSAELRRKRCHLCRGQSTLVETVLPSLGSAGRGMSALPTCFERHRQSRNSSAKLSGEQVRLRAPPIGFSLRGANELARCIVRAADRGRQWTLCLSLSLRRADGRAGNRSGLRDAPMRREPGRSFQTLIHRGLW